MDVNAKWGRGATGRLRFCRLGFAEIRMTAEREERGGGGDARARRTCSFEGVRVVSRGNNFNSLLGWGEVE